MSGTLDRRKVRSRMRDSWVAREGLPFPLGATWIEEERAYNFALYSKHAESVTLLIYGDHDIATPLFTHHFDFLKNKSGRIWHCRIPEAGIRGASYYAYSISGPPPAGRFEWHSFDPEKILLDAYAKAVYFPPAFDREAARQPGSNAGKAPLGLITTDGDAFDWQGDRAPRHDSDLIIYELHIKGFTKHPSCEIAPSRRGTYLGLVEKIPYLKELGVTAVELMPVFQFDPGEGSYWGYMPLSFFSPHHGYASEQAGCNQHQEFRAMVKALHQADIEVILDVVYNHTCEGDQNGPLYSYKGVDNSTYYLISPDPSRPYQNYSGTGNTMNCANRYVRSMILDSMRYWARQMHVDGFRFDLASVFSRNPDGSINREEPPIFGEIASDPDLANLRMIAEPWDAADSYQLGRSFPGISWLQWNGRFRDDVRRFLRGDPGLVPALMSRLYGSDDLFPDDRMNAYHAYQSVNYVTSHDGFTLYDLVSYNRKRNWANGHENRDGMDENYSWNCGSEGDEDLPEDISALRGRQIKNFCCLLFLSNGTPMLRAGDEFLNTQGGNNNPYNQDNETSWLDWDRLRRLSDIFRFFQKMISFRKSHPSVSRSRYWREDVRWYGVGQNVDMSLDSHSLAFYLDGASMGDADLYVMINGWWEQLTFVVQEGDFSEWKREIDTSLDSPDDFPDSSTPLASLSCVVQPRSIVVLIRPRVPA